MDGVNKELVVVLIIKGGYTLDDGGEAWNNILDALEWIGDVLVAAEIEEEEIHVGVDIGHCVEGQAVLDIQLPIMIVGSVTGACATDGQLGITLVGGLGEVADEPDDDGIGLGHFSWIGVEGL